MARSLTSPRLRMPCLWHDITVTVTCVARQREFFFDPLLFFIDLNQDDFQTKLSRERTNEQLGIQMSDLIETDSSHTTSTMTDEQWSVEQDMYRFPSINRVKRRHFPHYILKYSFTHYKSYKAPCYKANLSHQITVGWQTWHVQVRSGVGLYFSGRGNDYTHGSF